MMSVTKSMLLSAFFTRMNNDKKCQVFDVDVNRFDRRDAHHNALVGIFYTAVQCGCVRVPSKRKSPQRVLLNN